MSEDNAKRVGIFGGTFNPLHMGHINSMLSVTEKLGLDRVYAIPANQNPLKETAQEGPTAKQRLEMVKTGLSDYESVISVDEQEIVRGGNSYTVETVKKYADEHGDVSLIIGMDSFLEFDQWKDYQEILALSHLIVTSRPGHKRPNSVEELPKGVQKMVALFDPHFIELDSGKNIQFIELEDIDVSASEIRKKIRIGKNVDKYLPLTVEEFIKREGLYKPQGSLVEDYEAFTKFCGDALFLRKGVVVRGFDLRLLESSSEFTLIASGTSTRHTKSLAENLIRAVKEEYGVNPYSVEGLDEGNWVLVDFGSLIVHLFYDYVRNEYRLEELWRQGRDLMLQDPYIEKE